MVFTASTAWSVSASNALTWQRRLALAGCAARDRGRVSCGR
jgi:hypothetical protein